MGVGLSDSPKTNRSAPSRHAVVAAGIDIGGTDIKGGLVGADRTIVEQHFYDIEPDFHPWIL